MTSSYYLQDLYVYNRTASKAEPLASNPDLRCQVTQSVSQLGSTATIICLMLADDVACGSVLQELCTVGLKDKLVINHSTNTPEYAKSAAEQVSKAGGTYISAPVWGR